MAHVPPPSLLPSARRRDLARRLNSAPRPNPARRERGTGLLEVVTALVLVGVLLSLALRGGIALRDRWATEGARESLLQAVRETRARAVVRGGATLVVDAARAELRLETAADSLRRFPIGSDFGVTLDLGTTDEARLVFDAAGIGRMASRTIELRRGRARTAVVVSAYGRAR